MANSQTLLRNKEAEGMGINLPSGPVYCSATSPSHSDSMRKEIWVSIKYFDGYEISNFCRIKSLEKLIKNKTGGFSKKRERILTSALSKRGYYVITLTKNGKKYIPFVHRIFATAFLPNPENKPQINHKNGIKSDNRIENLEWTTQQENIVHAYKTGLNSAIKKIVQIKDGKIINKFESASDAGRKGFNRSHISRCLTGRLKTHHGFEWQYETVYVTISESLKEQAKENLITEINN